MKKVILFFCFLAFVGILSKGERKISTNAFDVNNNVDKDKLEIFKLWNSYLKSRPDSIYDNPYWNSAEKKTYYNYDLLESEGFINPSLHAFNYDNKVLEIRNEGDYYVIRSMFYTTWNDDLFILAITNYIVKKEDNIEYKLYNWLPFYTRNWRRKSLGIIDYCYYPEFPFNPYEAEKANKMIEALKVKLGAKINGKIRYYIAQNCDEINKLKGYDYVIGSGDKICNTCGYTDVHNNIIYADAVKGVNYQHELTRLINTSFPKANVLFINGLAEYFNETEKQLGLSHRQHYIRMNTYLNEHKNEDISNFQNSKFYTMDNLTAPYYLVGMIICQKTLEVGGVELLKIGLNAGSSDEDVCKFIESNLNIKKHNLNKFIRDEISKYANEDMKKHMIF